MDYYINELNKKEELFHDIMHEYPLFPEMIDDIFDKDIKEINDLLEKNDEYYLKEAIKKLDYLIDYIKKNSETIQKEYDKFDSLAKKWSTITLYDMTDAKLDIINGQIKKANELIKSHNIKDIREANQIMEELIREVSY